MLNEAIDAYKKTILLNPNYADAYCNMGVALNQKGNVDEAIELYNKALSIKPDYADAYYNLGNALKDQGTFDEAIEAYKSALLIKPDYAEAYCNSGMVFQDQGKLDEAVNFYKKSISLKPDSAKSYRNMGISLQNLGKTKDAVNSYNMALLINPDYAEAHKNLSFTLLNCGEFEEGLNEYEWRWKTDDFLSQQRGFLQPLWDRKKNLKGKRILVWCEQGIGDTINWSSCISFVATQAENCILECQEKLIPLLKRSFPNVDVKAENRTWDAERDDFDFHLPMGSLYKNFMEEILINKKVDPYLVPDAERVTFWKERLKSLGKGPFIGICWKSILMTPDRLPNYATISEWSPILTIPNVTFINLQPKDFDEDLIKVKDELGVTVHNFDDIDHFNDIDDVAALCTALDMVVSNKTTVPLISAGVGTSTKLANWRQSSWNNPLLNPKGPSVDIYERDTWMPWTDVFQLIKKDILEKFKYRRN
jgi:Flp pilus assembly protein TadD